MDILITPGRLPYMLDEYPDVSFAVHEAEAPFVIGSKQYQHLKGDTWTFAVGKWYMPTMNASLPVSRQILLKGAKGDLATEVSWLPKSVLTYNHVPGHSPGQVFFTHHSTNSVITGDVITNMSPSFPVSRKSNPKCDNPFAAPTHNWHDMKTSQNTLASVDGVETYFPSHDDGTGVTVADLKAFVGSEHEELLNIQACFQMLFRPVCHAITQAASYWTRHNVQAERCTISLQSCSAKKLSGLHTCYALYFLLLVGTCSAAASGCSCVAFACQLHSYRDTTRGLCLSHSKFMYKEALFGRYCSYYYKI